MAKQQIILDEFFPYQLVQLAQRVSANLSQIYKDRFDLTVPEWRVMACLGERERATAKTIGEASFMDKVKTSRAIKSLQTKGLLKKEQDAHDSRAYWISLNAKGKQHYKALTPEALQWENQLLTGLTAKEQGQLRHILEKLSGHLNTMK